MELKRCVYCGLIADSKDHIPAVALRQRLYSQGLRWRYPPFEVPACRECNSMIGADGLTFEERQQILKKRLAKKYRKAHLFPDWSDEELAKLDPGILKESVIRSLALRESINARLAYLGAPPPIKKPPTPVITFYPKAEDCWDCKRKISYGACKHCVQRAKDIVRAEEARKELYEQEERKYAAMVAENRRLGSIKGGETNRRNALKAREARGFPAIKRLFAQRYAYFVSRGLAPF